MKISVEGLAQRLQSELGADGVNVDSGALAAHCVDGKSPALVCAPALPEQIVALLRVCGEAAATVVPWGGGSAIAVGNPPRQVDVVVETARLKQVIDHDHANLTVTAQSGMTISALQSALAPEQQFVPFDAPFPDRSTIGGIVAANLNGPRRSSYGNVRDLVIGMKVALGSGESVKAGGKVVKNVAGYDMCKLFTGSLGTLGIITELTVRVAPMPRNSATMVATGSLNQTLRLAGEIEQTKLLPTAIFLRSDPLARNWRFAVWFDGFEATVARQLHDVTAIVEATEMRATTLQIEQHVETWRDMRDFPLQPGRSIFRVIVPRTAVAEVIREIASWQTDPAIVADLAVGIIWFAIAAHRPCAEQFFTLGSLAERHRGHAVLFAAAPEVKRGIEVWGPAPPTIALMREIKRQFDPAAILNPGRFVGGL